MQNEITILEHNTQIKTENDKYQPHIMFKTLRGCVTEDYLHDKVSYVMSNDGITMRKANSLSEKIKHDIEQAEANDKKYNTTEYTRPFSSQRGAMITSDYEGKKEKLEQERIDYENAVMLHDGQIVKVIDYDLSETLYRVELKNKYYDVCDPVHFIKLENND